tara:strand:- start:2175 stop:2786 length:612 start_codon:yes stop_codon:yes gene_type:complete
MKFKSLTIAALSLSLGLVATTSYSAAVSDTLNSSNPGVGSTYWVPTDGQKFSDPYYREYGEDWGWTHNAIAGVHSSASLNISAFDVDAPSEVDEIEAYDTDTAAWIKLGNLAGANDVWAFTNFVLDLGTWQNEINLGLQVRMLIDTGTQGNWLVTLAKSTLSVDGGVLPPPTPGEVPLPAAVWLFGSALAGFIGMRRKSKVVA